MASIPKKVSERFTKQSTRFKKVLNRAKDRDVNEADTVAIIGDMLAEIFGYDKYLEVTSELAIRGTFCDLAVKIDEKIKFIVEVKAIGIDLKDSHLRQAVNYGATAGIPWIVLTNGIEWEVHKIRFDQPVQHDEVCTFNFLELNTRKKEDMEKLFLVCKEGINKSAMEEYHERAQTINRFVIGAIVQGPSVIKVIRRELRKVTPGLHVTEDEIQEILVNEVFKREVVEGESTAKMVKRVKKIAGDMNKKKSTPKVVENQEDPGPPT